MKWILALGAAAFALAAAAFGQDGRRITAPPDTRTQLDLQHYYLPRDLQVALSALELAYPEFLRLESLGRSGTGAELWVMTVARKDGLEPAKRPAALLVAGLGLDDLAATEQALYSILDLVQNHGRDDAVARILRDCTVYVAPCLNPDLRERVLAAVERGESPASAGEESVLLERNFPVRWDPLTTERAGPYPLSRPEARALAEFLILRPNIALVQRYGSASSRTSADFGWPEADVRTHRRVAADGLMDSVDSLARREGALLSFAYEQTGAFAFELPSLARVGAEVLPRVDEILPLARTAASSTLRLLASLPALELVAAPPTALDPQTWQLDLELRNTGRLPSASELGVARFAVGAPQLELSGAQLAGAALVRASDSVATPLSVRGSGAELPQIEGGAVLRLRLFVAGTSGATAVLNVRTPRAGVARVEVVLP